MAEMMNVGRSGSSRVMPVEEQMIDISGINPSADDGGEDGGGILSGRRQEEEERNPQDAWLPITESRKGNALTATLHLLCSGIGVQTLMLPLAFVSLGWFWGIICLSLAFSWQLYTTWLLINLHESVPPNGVRYSRFLHLSIGAFGEKLGKLLAMFPTMYLSGGTCVLYIIGGGTTIEMMYQTIVCGTTHQDHHHAHKHMEYDLHNCHSKTMTMTGTECFLVFICLAIFIALFFPNLNSLTWISFVGSITVVEYCMILSFLSQHEAAREGSSYHLKKTTVEVEAETSATKFRDVMSGIGLIALAFRGHNLILEIQGTMPSNQKQPSRKPMLRGMYISYLLVAMCLYPLAIIGYWAYGDNKAILKEGILGAYTKTFHQKHTSSKSTLLVVIYFIIIINYLCAFQIYAMPTFDNLQRIYVSKKNGPCPRWIRSGIKLFFGGLTYLISMAFPFLPSLGGFIGSIALPLTLAYPCLMWAAIKKPKPFTTMWALNIGLGSFGLVLSLLLAVAALWSLIINGLDANFFKPK